MKKTILYVLAGLAFLGLAGTGITHLYRQSSPPKSASPKSEVKKVDGTPRILIDGKDKISFINHIYYYGNANPATGAPSDAYSTQVWLKGVKSQMDGMVKDGANTLFLDILWSDLVTAKTKPADLEGSINFDPLDEAMAYAQKNNLYMILNLKPDIFSPPWWKKENNFPDAVTQIETGGKMMASPGVTYPCIPQEKNSDHACIPKEICAENDGRCCSSPKEELSCCVIDIADPQPGSPIASGVSVNLTKDGMAKCKLGKTTVAYSRCAECETDSYGWKYNNPGMSSESFRKDYSDFASALINRYKENKPLIGWGFSLGASGEDIYGPSYIPLRAVYGTLMGEGKTDQIADYSDDAQKKFKLWMKEKYKSDQALQTAWGDNSLTLEKLKLPDPKKVFKQGKEGPFPDDWYTGIFIDLDVLSERGKDLYDFREAMRDAQRSYFTGLIKGLDKNHILVYVGTNNAGIYNDRNIDAILGANHVEYSVNDNLENNFIAMYGLLNKKHGKANIFALESVGETSGIEGKSIDKEKQKAALLDAYKVIKCVGGHLGYVDSFGKDMPIWTATDKKVFREIGRYTPTNDCICDLIDPDTTLIRKRVSDIAKTFGIEKLYPCKGDGSSVQSKSQNLQPKAQSPSDNGQTGKQAGKNGLCGDGTCDSIEKSSGMCLIDCQ